MSDKQQSYASHAKIDPFFHFFVLPVLLLNIFVVGYLLLRYPGIGGAWLLLVSIALINSWNRFNVAVRMMVGEKWEKAA